MGIHIGIPENSPEIQLQPKITVVGVGGAGGNAVNNMIFQEILGVDFVVANTDAQSLTQARTERRIQLGMHTTQGLGAGAKPTVGRDSADEALELIAEQLKGSHMVFIAAGMGGGTGTGAAPVIAAQAREMGILTVGVVTKPFQFEGIHRMQMADDGIEELAQYVDTLIVIPNQNLFRIANEKTTFADAFKMADDVLCAGVRSVTDLMLMPGLINLDFADVKSVMSEMGKAMMGTGEAAGETRALEAAEAAISNPLLEDSSMKGANGVLINITGGPDMTLYEVDEAANRIRDEVETNANIIFGSTFDPNLEGTMRVSVVATGIAQEAMAANPKNGNLYDMIAHRENQRKEVQVEEPTQSMETVLEAAQSFAADLTPEDIAPAAPIVREVTGDSFIPEAPVAPMDTAPNFSPAEETMEVAAAQQEDVLEPAPAPEAPEPEAFPEMHVEPEKKSRSLWERVTQRRTPAEAEAPAAPQIEDSVSVEQAGLAPSMAPSSAPMDTSQPTFTFESGPQTLPESDEQMDIPAFLRRQAN